MVLDTEKEQQLSKDKLTAKSSSDVSAERSATAPTRFGLKEFDESEGNKPLLVLRGWQQRSFVGALPPDFLRPGPRFKSNNPTQHADGNSSHLALLLQTPEFLEMLKKIRIL